MRIILLLSFLLAVSLTGCKEPCGCDEKVLASDPMVTPTDSTTRNWSPQVVAYQNAGISHPTLYLRGYTYECFTDETVNRPWNADDAVSVVATPLDYALGIVAMPVSLAAKPAWKTEISRGSFALDSH